MQIGLSALDVFRSPFAWERDLMRQCFGLLILARLQTRIKVCRLVF